MQISLFLGFLAVSVIFVSVDSLKPYFGKEYKFDKIEFPSELKRHDFTVRFGDVEEDQYEKATNAIFAIAVRLRALLDYGADSGDNLLISPLSICLVLGQLLLGAKGESRRELSEILSTTNKNGSQAAVPDLEFHKHFKTLLSILKNVTNPNTGYTLDIASAFFLQHGLRMRSDYQHAVTDFYGSELTPINFSGDPVRSQQIINNWANQNTHGRITSILPYPLPPTTASLITNAIYFRGAWENPFDPELTITGAFKMNSRERVAVKYMRGQFDLKYAESERLGCQMLMLPYKNKEAVMHIFLPSDKEYDIRNFTSSLTINDIVDLKRSATERSVTLIMPRMTMKGSFSLKEPLKRFRKTLTKRPEVGSPRREKNPSIVRSRGKREEPGVVMPRGKREEPGVVMPRGKREEPGVVRPRGKREEPGVVKPRYKREEPGVVRPRGKREEPGVVRPRGKREDLGNVKRTISNNRGRTEHTSSLKINKEVTNPEDSIKTEIITSSIMIPAAPLIVMEVDKTYTVSLNGSESSESGSEHLTPRQGEFNSMPNYQIHTHLLTHRNAPHYSADSLQPNYKFQIPNQSIRPTIYPNPSDRVVPYGSKDLISFPSAEMENDKFSRPLLNVQQNSSAHGERSTAIPPPSFSIVELATERGPVSQDFQGDVDFDLTGASDDSRFRIDDLLHEVWLEVTEEGTEGAAITSSTVNYSGDVKLFLVDRPFFAVILHEETKSVLFWCTVVDPTGGKGQRTDDPLGRPSAAPNKLPSVVHSRGR